MGTPWVGVDLDGTLAYHEPGYMRAGIIGKPLPEMAGRVREQLRQGTCIKIFTSRAVYPEQIKLIQIWLEKHGFPPLEITNAKDPDCLEIWDDSARRVIKNTGQFA